MHFDRRIYSQLLLQARINNIPQDIGTVEITNIDKRKKRINPGIKPRDALAATSHVHSKLVSGQQPCAKV